MKSIFRSKTKLPVLILGWILLLVGVLGLLLPLLPGIPPLIAGLVILSREYDWARRVLARIQRWLPAISEQARRIWRRVGKQSSQRATNRTSTCANYQSNENQ
jgi:uncharacterized membrane protein YbaN (DUF454 family)